MSLEEKLAKLNISPLTDDVYHEHLKNHQLRGMDVRGWKYYKIYGNEIMLYSKEYINNNTLDELIEQDKRNKRMFCPSLIDRIIRRIDAFKFKYLDKLLG